MRRVSFVPKALLFAAVVVAACAAIGCKKSGASRLEGHWRGTRSDGVAPDAVVAANAFAASTELDFHGDVLTVKTSQGKQTGKFRVVREDGKSVVVVTDEDGPKDEQTFTFDDDKSMRWRVLPDKTILFQKE